MERISDPREMEAVESLLWLETSENATSPDRNANSDGGSGSGGSGGTGGSRRVLAPLPVPFSLASMTQRMKKSSFSKRKAQGARKISNKSRSEPKTRGLKQCDMMSRQKGDLSRRESPSSQLLPSIADLFDSAGENDELHNTNNLLSRLDRDFRPCSIGITNPRREAFRRKIPSEPCVSLPQAQCASDSGSEECHHDDGKDLAHPGTSSPLPPSSLDEEAEDLRAARAEFCKRIFFRQPTTPRGFVSCLLCRKDCWAPNGRYHVDTCTAVLNARRARQVFVGETNIPMPPKAAFSRPANPSRRPGKIPGFVVADAAPGKGYVECLVCSRLVWAPNSARHRIQCKMTFDEAPAGSRNEAGGNVNLTDSKWTLPLIDAASVPSVMDLLCYESLSD